MFGYVRPHMSELRVREADVYRAFYCGVCRRLGKQCGPACRLFLQYDFAMLALTMDVVFEEQCGISRVPCAVNPLNHLNAADGDAVRYAADAHGILLLGKAMDDRADGGILRRVPVQIIRRMTKAACGRRKWLHEAMAAMLAAQAAAERDAATRIDDACEPFGEFCAAMFTPDEAPEAYRETLRWMGLHLGKWIYMADALDDYDKDMKKEVFNPWRCYGTRSEAVERALPHMNLCAEQALLAWDVLPDRRAHAIVRNILEMGLYETAKRIANKK